MSGVIIERYPDRFVFINPGTMLVPVEDFFRGGKSICRNPYLQDMFIAIGRGEHLGSGADIIEKGWKENGWPEPEIKETFGAQTDGVELTLRLGQNTKSEEKSKGKSKGKTKDRIKELMSENKHITLPEIADTIGLTLGAIEKSTRIMQKAEEIKHHGPSNGGYWEVLK